MLADLRRRRDRRSSGLVLVEGPTLLGEALSAGCRPQLVAATSAAHQGSWELVAASAAAGARVVTLADHEAARASDTEHGTGLLAAVAAPPGWEGRVEPGIDALVPLLWGLQDPGNVGTLIRSARAFGALACVLASGTADATGPKALRASAGAALHLPIGSVAGADELQALAHDAQLTIVLASAPPAGHPGPSQSLPDRCLLVMGHETRGVPQIEGARTAHVSHSPDVESLNVGVAGAILMADWYRSRVERRDLDA